MNVQIKRVSHIVIYTSKRYQTKQYKAVQFPIHHHRILARITQDLAVENRYTTTLKSFSLVLFTTGLITPPPSLHDHTHTLDLYHGLSTPHTRAVYH